MKADSAKSKLLVNLSVALVSTQRINKLLERKEVVQIMKVPLPRGSKVYLVGGYVRDFLLRRKSLDIDVAIDGKFDEVLERFGKKIPGKVTRYPNFQTASIESDGIKYDFVRTRKEYYSKAAILPEVSIGTIDDDLTRRDFTINAMAITLKPKPGELIDITDGYRDIRRRKIRVLHEKSFKDDPTRIFRAYRYARRFSFSIDKMTQQLIKDNLDYVKYLTSERIINELKLIAEEKNSLNIIKDLKNCSLLSRIFDRTLIKRAKLASNRLLFLLAHLKSKILEDAPLNLSVLKSAKELKKIEKIATKLKKTKSRSSCYKLLAKLEPSTIKMVRALFPELGEKIRKFQKDQSIKPFITGADLIMIGLKPSRKFKKILDRLFSLQIERRIKSKKEAESLLQKWNLS